MAKKKKIKLKNPKRFICFLIICAAIIASGILIATNVGHTNPAIKQIERREGGNKVDILKCEIKSSVEGDTVEEEEIIVFSAEYHYYLKDEGREHGVKEFVSNRDFEIELSDDSLGQVIQNDNSSVQISNALEKDKALTIVVRQGKYEQEFSYTIVPKQRPQDNQ